MKTVFPHALLMLVSLVLLTTINASALVSEDRPGVPYFGEVLFLQKKLVENGKVVAASLAYTDPRDNVDLCLNRIDVFGGLEKFNDISEKKWVLVDFYLQSVLIAEGFSGDADVTWVRECPDVDTCLAMSEERSKDPEEQERRASAPRPEKTVKTNLDDISQKLDLGRKLVKAARCRGCHNIEGTGPTHAPSLTWKRVKYEIGWLQDYLAAPYRMRPAMDNLMMLKYTSPNAMPSLQQVELEVVTDYLERVAVTSAPGDDLRRELWEDYDCYNCHVRIYKEKPLAFEPTVLPQETKRSIEKYPVMNLCFSCHAFGDMHMVKELPTGSANAFAPDLLLTFEKLDLTFLINYLVDPVHMVPATRMPDLGLEDEQIQQVREFAKEVKNAIEAGAIKPKHVYYELEKKDVH